MPHCPRPLAGISISFPFRQANFREDFELYIQLSNAKCNAFSACSILLWAAVAKSISFSRSSHRKSPSVSLQSQSPPVSTTNTPPSTKAIQRTLTISSTNGVALSIHRPDRCLPVPSPGSSVHFLRYRLIPHVSPQFTDPHSPFVVPIHKYRILDHGFRSNQFNFEARGHFKLSKGFLRGKNGNHIGRPFFPV